MCGGVKMTKPINDYNGENKFRLGQLVQTKSGLVGKVIGYAEYRTGWEYRIKVDGKKNTMYRKQEELKLPSEKKKRERK